MDKISIDETLVKLLEEDDDDLLFLNHNLISKYGLEAAALIAVLMDRLAVYRKNNNILESKGFSITDVELAVYSGIKFNRISEIKDLCIEKKLFTVRKNIETKELYYKLNEKKISKIILDKKEKIKVPPFKKNL
jgi:hypothetical protein